MSRRSLFSCLVTVGRAGLGTRKRILILAALVIIAGLVLLVACSGGNKATTASTGTVNLSLSDPAPCAAASSGPYDAIYITIRDVRIHTSTTAGPNDPGWIDLASSLTNAPMQINLVGQANPQCILAMLGSSTSLQAGTYQQIRVMLADNTAANASAVAGNKCGTTAVNCVFLQGSSTPQPLIISSEFQQGIKIPSGQIAGGQFQIGPGETKDLNIDVDSCASIVVAKNGQFRLKPVLHAGEVSLQSAINGKLVNADGTAISGIKAVVTVEQIPLSGGTVKRVVMQTATDSTGAFNLCPVPPGTYDVVAVAINGSNVAYATAIITGVPAGTALGNIPIVSSSLAPGGIKGLVTTATAPEDVTLSVLQQAGGSTYTVPLPGQASPSATANVTTAPTSGTLTCPAGTNCIDATLVVPGVTPTVVAFAAGTPISFASLPAPTSPAAYTLEGATDNCTESTVTIPTTAGTFINVNPGVTTDVTSTPIAFTGCTAPTP